MKEVIPYLLIFITIMIVNAILRHEPSNNYCKRFVLSHVNEWKSDSGFNKNYYVISHTDRKYYIDVTIRLVGEDGYSVIFWGNRKSWLWRFRLDKHFTIDVPYRESKHYDVTMDKEILRILKTNELPK